MKQYFCTTCFLLAILLTGCGLIPDRSQPGSQISPTPDSEPSNTPFQPQDPSNTPAATTTLTNTPPSPSATQEASQTPTPARTLRLSVLYNNIPDDVRLQTDWGFACLVETGQTTLLFDTGANGQLLLQNMQTLGIDPRQIDLIVLSHEHYDHTGGLGVMPELAPDATLIVPAAFSENLKSAYRTRERLIEVEGWTEIEPGLYVTGPIGGAIIEQALAIETSQGLVVITGCAHPGIVETVQNVHAHGEIRLVLGGFHLVEQSTARINSIIQQLQELGVKQTAPSHCSGSTAMTLFQNAWGDDFLSSGAGAIIEMQ